MSTVDLRRLLGEHARIRALTQCIRARIPAHDVDDVVQSTLTAALCSSASWSACPPQDEPAVDRWLLGIARHKVADYYRSHRRREWIDGDIDHDDVAADTHAESARDLLHWVQRELAADPQAPRTLEWMMREADGDRLETIAAENDISAPAVRQRVSRLRRYLRQRWSLQLAAVVTLLALIVGVYTHRRPAFTLEPEPTLRARSPARAAQKLRESALVDCRNGHWQACLERLDRAKTLDPAGDRASAVIAARADIERALLPTPNPAPSPSEQRLVPAGQDPKSIEPVPRQVAPPQSLPIKRNSSKKTSGLSQSAPSQVSSNAQKSTPTRSPQKAIGKAGSLNDFGFDQK